MNSIFLSASVPRTDSEYYDQCDPMLIQAALRTFLFTVLGRKHLVFGGHPSISPLILAACKEVGVANKAAVTIYQSNYFKTVQPKENTEFANFIVTQATSDRTSSLEKMRSFMLRRHRFEAAVFIGGEDGVLQEHALFRQRHPNAKILALKSPGGAAASIESSISDDYDELIDYVGLFTTDLQIGLNSERNLSLNTPGQTPSSSFDLG